MTEVMTGSVREPNAAVSGECADPQHTGVVWKEPQGSSRQGGQQIVKLHLHTSEQSPRRQAGASRCHTTGRQRQCHAERGQVKNSTCVCAHGQAPTAARVGQRQEGARSC